MLVQKNFNTGDVLAIKLISGEEIICKLKDITSSHINIYRPFSMVLLPNEKNQGSVVFAPFMLGAEDGSILSLDITKVITYTKANVQSSAQYIKATAGSEPTDNVVKLFN
jgi:hypothetical protein